MAFDFLGQFSRDEYEEFIEFLDKEYESIDARISGLTTEIARVETLINKLDQAENNFLSKYEKIRKIEYFNGVEDVETEYRTKDSVLKNVINASDYPTDINDDIDSGYIIKLMKNSIEDSIKYKRERLEFKIKKSIDLYDQLVNEKLILSQRKEDIQDLKDRIEDIFLDPRQIGVVENKKERERDRATKEFLTF